MENIIRVDDLKIIFSRIIDKLSSEGVESINIEDDTYRLIPTERWSDFTSDEVDLGSLHDDLEELKKLIDKDRFCTYVDFDRLSAVLRAISQIQNPLT